MRQLPDPLLSIINAGAAKLIMAPCIQLFKIICVGVAIYLIQRCINLLCRANKRIEFAGLGDKTASALLVFRLKLLYSVFTSDPITQHHHFRCDPILQMRSVLAGKCKAIIFGM